MMTNVMTHSTMLASSSPIFLNASSPNTIERGHMRPNLSTSSVSVPNTNHMIIVVITLRSSTADSSACVMSVCMSRSPTRPSL
ncbi:hypothetical protein SMC26_16590 [Actinomadura fulvescens]|uniref:hypothetical protein n=1 Tax=Actinomadura fulvescens TaxID=46160 RepID=UPI0031D29291